MTELKPCGTRAAYRRHRARGEDPCTPCRRANSDYLAERVALAHQRMIDGVDDPPHGKDSTYNHYGCRCAACKEAHRAACQSRVESRRDEINAYQREWNHNDRRLRNRGGCWSDTDQRALADHVKRLCRDVPTTVEAVARAANVNGCRLKSIVDGHSRATWSTWEAVMAVTEFDVVAATYQQGWQPADVTRARLLAMRERMGTVWIAAQLGVSDTVVRRWCRSNQRWVKASTARRVRDLYERWLVVQRRSA